MRVRAACWSCLTAHRAAAKGLRYRAAQQLERQMLNDRQASEAGAGRQPSWPKREQRRKCPLGASEARRRGGPGGGSVWNPIGPPAMSWRSHTPSWPRRDSARVGFSSASTTGPAPRSCSTHGSSTTARFSTNPNVLLAGQIGRGKSIAWRSRWPAARSHSAGGCVHLRRRQGRMVCRG